MNRKKKVFHFQAGTELTTHYKLDMEEAGSNEHSQWYVDLWEKFSLRSSDKQTDQANSQFGLEQKEHISSEQA